MKIVHLVLIGIVSLLLIGCNTANIGSSKPAKVSDLQGVWKLQDVNKTAVGLGNNPITLVYDSQYAEDVSGFAGCNNYGAKVNGGNGLISFSKIYSTKMACPNIDVETNYFNLLDKVNRFEIKRNNLYLYKDKLLLLHFQK